MESTLLTDNTVFIESRFYRYGMKICDLQAIVILFDAKLKNFAVKYIFFYVIAGDSQAVVILFDAKLQDFHVKIIFFQAIAGDSQAVVILFDPKFKDFAVKDIAFQMIADFKASVGCKCSGKNKIAGA
jgi:hypothetical protein